MSMPAEKMTLPQNLKDAIANNNFKTTENLTQTTTVISKYFELFQKIKTLEHFTRYRRSPHRTHEHDDLMTLEEARSQFEQATNYIQFAVDHNHLGIACYLAETIRSTTSCLTFNNLIIKTQDDSLTISDFLQNYQQKITPEVTAALTLLLPDVLVKITIDYFYPLKKTPESSLQNLGDVQPPAVILSASLSPKPETEPKTGKDRKPPPPPPKG